MSYILEALKKAERARELGRDVAPEPRREMVYGARPRIGLRVASGALALLLLGGGLLLWRLGPPLSTPLPPAPPERARTIPEASGDRLPAAASGDPAPASTSRADARPALRSPQAPAPTPPRQPPGPARPPARSAGPVGDAAHVAVPVGSSPAALPLEADRMAPAPPAAGTTTDAPPSPAPQPPPATPAPRAQAAPAPLSLQAAVARMSLTVLVYTEARASRLVVINGRQYLEGQLVDDRYLLESIRPEGAMLVHEGERVLLGN